MEPFIGQLMCFAGNFAPRGWAKCEGQLLDIAQNSALFSILGTMYGGDGRTTFGLPDLRGRVPMGAGQGSGLASRTLGAKGGKETVTLTKDQMPSHTHTATTKATTAGADTTAPNDAFMAKGAQTYSASARPDTTMHRENVVNSTEGGNQAHNNMQPFIVMTWCVALQGTFPSRN